MKKSPHLFFIYNDIHNIYLSKELSYINKASISIKYYNTCEYLVINVKKSCINFSLKRCNIIYLFLYFIIYIFGTFYLH